MKFDEKTLYKPIMEDSEHISQCNDDLSAIGYGLNRNDEGAIYEGFWNYSLKNGFGREIQTNGDVYEGKWRSN